MSGFFSFLFYFIFFTFLLLTHHLCMMPPTADVTSITSLLSLFVYSWLFYKASQKHTSGYNKVPKDASVGAVIQNPVYEGGKKIESSYSGGLAF